MSFKLPKVWHETTNLLHLTIISKCTDNLMKIVKGCKNAAENTKTNFPSIGNTGGYVDHANMGRAVVLFLSYLKAFELGMKSEDNHIFVFESLWEHICLFIIAALLVALASWCRWNSNYYYSRLPTNPYSITRC